MNQFTRLIFSVLFMQSVLSILFRWHPVCLAWYENTNCGNVSKDLAILFSSRKLSLITSDIYIYLGQAMQQFRAGFVYQTLQNKTLTRKREEESEIVKTEQEVPDMYQLRSVLYLHKSAPVGQSRLLHMCLFKITHDMNECS